MAKVTQPVRFGTETLKASPFRSKARMLPLCTPLAVDRIN